MLRSPPWRCRLFWSPPPWLRLSRSSGIELGLRVGLGGVELDSRVRSLGGGLLLQIPGVRLGLIGLCGGEHLVEIGEIGVGAFLELLQLSERRWQRCGLT